MESVKLIGSDVGNDALKIYLDEPNYEGKRKFEVMNVIAPGYNRRILGQEKGSLSNLLDVTIYQDDKELGRYFVGGQAYKNHRGDLIEKNKMDVKAKSIYTIIMLMTGIAYALYDPKDRVKTQNIDLGTLLPTEEYWSEDEDLAAIFAKEIKKKYKVIFNSPSFNGAEITLNIVDLDIMPESVAGHLTAIYNMDGTVKDGVEVNNEVHLGIFVGSITTEVSVLIDGEFDERGFFGIDIGTSDPLDKIIADINLNLTRHQVDYLIRKNKPLIVNVGGERRDYTSRLKEISEKRFDFFTTQLVNEINKKLSLQGINPNLVTKVNLGGGGAISTIDSFKKKFTVGNVSLVEDPRFANAYGALYTVKQKNDEQDAAADEVLGE